MDKKYNTKYMIEGKDQSSCIYQIEYINHV